ncbi:Imidazolonepropionase [Nitrosomonas aestuarii]|uniref:Imidazolonepropionase n=1 Tax=Nitrosomonas aestuarii TaxID=52441 RepID=A0A1I3ZTW8_9PROT|nr:amidohydrolase family protein [Nitrosomonas aestuarii]SFK47572.1 Imidazolonepropionase [Nitrosomonas aestuarii]
MVKTNMVGNLLLLIGQIQLGLVLLLSGIAPSLVTAADMHQKPLLLHASRVFDGNQIRTNLSILIKNGQVSQIERRELLLVDEDVKIIELGDATILPGLIELHAHLAYRKVPPEIVLQHGITTIRDLGGPVHAPYGGNGSLRVLTSGPIITAPDGYPISNLGATNIARAVSSEEEARKTVRDLVSAGAVVIKVALEPGGEVGAPWSVHHGHGKHAHDDEQHAHAPGKQVKHHQHSSDIHHSPKSRQAWPLLSEKIVTAIVSEAHHNNRRVTAHIAEEKGARIALNAGVDEWAHMPCDVIPEALLKQAVSQNVKIVTTIDTLSKCTGIESNTRTWSALGGEILYGAEIAHPEIPWGINTQELMYMMQFTGMQLVDTLRTATSLAGEHIGLFPKLGTIQLGAPADIVAVKGDLALDIKKLEYPDLVISGGQIIVNKFLN